MHGNVFYHCSILIIPPLPAVWSPSSQIDIEEVVELHDAIIHSGKDMRKPMNLAKQMKGVAADEDVNAALMMLLSPEVRIYGMDLWYGFLW